MSLTVKQRIALQRYWTRFLQGLMLFSVGAALIYAGYIWWFWLQVPGALILLLGLACAIYGYAGLLRFRLKAAFSLRDKSKNNQ